MTLRRRDVVRSLLYDTARIGVAARTADATPLYGRAIPTDRSSLSADEARLLPRLRGGAVDRVRLQRVQAAVLLERLDRDPDAALPLRHSLTKPGDPLALRGIPAIGRSVSGAIGQTQPEQETVRRITQRERLRERTEA